MKIKSDNLPNTINKYFCEKIMIIEEKQISGINLTDSAIFPPALIKRETFIFNQKKLKRDTKQRIFTIEINNGWNTKVVQILHAKRDGKFNLSVNHLSRLPNIFEVSQEEIFTGFKYQDPYFYATLFDESE